MFGYGFLAVVLVLYLDASGLDPLAIGAVLTLTLIGDTLVSLWLTTHADRLGRRRVLIVSSLLVVIAGIVFALTDWLPLLILAGIVGVISPTGNEVGPFLAVEQSSLTQIVPDRRRTATFAWYNVVGYVATATGALAAGLARPGADRRRMAGGRCLPRGGRRLCPDRPRHGRRSRGGSAPASRSPRHRRRPMTASPVDWGSDDRARWSSACRRCSRSTPSPVGFIPQSLMAYWFTVQFGVSPGDARADLLRRQSPRRRVVAVGSADRSAHRPHRDDGVHAPAIERAADPRPAHADVAPRGRGPAACGSASARWTCRRGSPT